jgi:hypothetical protein
MKYIKGNQETILTLLPLIKISLVDSQGDVERIWAREGEGDVYLANRSISFPHPTWGVAFPCSGGVAHLPEVPSETLTLHPDAWEEYIKMGTIDKEGNFL